MIHSTAIIDPSAIIADDVSIGPYAIIGADVEIGKGCQIESHVVIKGPTKIGQNNHIHQFSSVGEHPLDKKSSGEPTLLDIGDNNLIREGVTINRGTVQGGGTTKIGDNNWIMAYVHIAHDCIVGNDNILANNTTLAGHVIIDDFTEPQIKNIRQAYKLTYRSTLKVEEANNAIQQLDQQKTELSVYTTFLEQQRGGIIR